MAREMRGEAGVFPGGAQILGLVLVDLEIAVADDEHGRLLDVLIQLARWRDHLTHLADAAFATGDLRGLGGVALGLRRRGPRPTVTPQPPGDQRRGELD